MKIAIDTNRYADFCRGDPLTLEILETANEVKVPFIVLGELRAGFSAGRRGAENESILRRFLTRPGVEVLFSDGETTQHYARVYLQLRKQGTPIPTNDLWIAALVLQHDLSLFDRDSHFDDIAQLVRVKGP